jgi:hypothetical protein
MNLSVKASYQPTFMKLWAQCQRDALDFVTFTGVPEDFARLLTEKGIPYVVN